MLDLLFQGGDPLRLCGLASAVLSIYAFFPYASDTIRGRTHPQRACWLIWSVLGSIALVTQSAEGATESLWFAAIQVIWTIAIFTLAIWRGTGPFLNPGDAYILAAAAMGLAIWAVTHDAAHALIITISISMLGGMATILKAYRAPGSETMATWIVSWIAAACAVFAVGSIDWILMAYPLYLLMLYSGIVGAMVLGRSRGRAIEFATARHVPVQTV
ncbi:hypothetical protein [uncultured Tateyamaria sp.]|uniref:hypothetical protein n=1 Tax=uncultured Tateyamaria sp. TaxID=455651 RepID=UPI0026368D8D|nr:hypothetical protein [uncultured Tateyamaria sp.]